MGSQPAFKRVGRFSLEAEIGGGGAGTVYRGRDTVNDQLVAVKLIVDLDNADLVRFHREAFALSKLRHPNIVSYVDHGTTPEGAAFIGMEWLEGEDLRARLMRGGLTVDETIVMARQVAGALMAVHSSGLIHRDVKPANIFLVKKSVENVRLIDMGLVRAITSNSDLTRTGIAVGTPAYMSPEQARGERDIDARSDLYSLGCVLFRCLTGKTPFESSSIVALLTKMLLDEAPRVRSLRPDVPTLVDEMVYHLLQKSPDDRTQTAAALIETLDALEPADTEAIAPPVSVRHLGITASERRVRSMLLIGHPPSLSNDPKFIENLSPIANRHRGSVHVTVGGTVAVTFSDPESVADQAARAAHCALAVHGPFPDAPMALATDWSTGDAVRPEKDVIERAAILLEGATEDLREPRPESSVIVPPIAVDSVTAALISGRFQLIEQGPGQRLVSTADVSPNQSSSTNQSSPFVGRDWELSSLLRLFNDSLAESAPRAALITGPSGHGKSRLAYETLRNLLSEHQNLVVWSARGDSLRAGSPFGMLARIIESAAGTRPGEPLTVRREKLFSWVSSLVGETRALPVAAFLGEALSVPFELNAIGGLLAARAEPALMTQKIESAFQDVMAAQIARGPMLLLLDDMQWSDAPTVRAIDSSLLHLEKSPWAVFAFARPDIQDAFPRLWSDRALQEIRLKPLSRRAAEQLVRHSLGADAPAALVERIVKQADGNVFYVEEILRAIKRDPNNVSFPDSVIAMVHDRFESLSAQERRALRAASIFGDVFWVRGVDFVLGGTSTTGSFGDLASARDLVVRQPRSRFEDEEELSFRHSVFREAAYAALTPEDQVLGHGLAAEWLESRGETDAMLLAKHYDLANQPHRAARHRLALANRSLYACDLDEAVYQAELVVLGNPSPPILIAASELLAQAHAWSFEWVEALTHSETILRLATPKSAAYWQALSIKLTAALLLTRPEEMLQALLAATQTDSEDNDIPTAALAMSTGVVVASLMGQRQTAQDLIEKLDAFAARPDLESRLGRPSYALFLARRELARIYPEVYGGGNPWEALVHASTAKQFFSEIGDRRNCMYADCYGALARAALGDVETAENELRSITDKKLSLITIARDNHLMHLLLRSGRYEEARVHIEARLLSAKEIAGPMGQLVDAAARWILGELTLRTGDAASAVREIGAALDGGLRYVPLDLPVALAVLSSAHLELGQKDQALRTASEAMDVLPVAGVTAFRHAGVLLAYANALIAVGDKESAQKVVQRGYDHIQTIANQVTDTNLKTAYLTKVRDNAALIELWNKFNS
ncbi:MAG: protein kinase [Polyangiaceae bacterium]|nr:protein kinase [Polyangiaceae bacterium]